MIPAAFQKTNSPAILVLDDEPSIAELLGEMLEVLGYSSTLCSAPRQAVELVRSREFDLILSDFRMPALNGQQFYELVCNIRPELSRRVVFLTGDVVNEGTQHFLKKVGNPHLPKPFQLSQVETILNQMLEAKAAQAN